jgi:tRNA (mo5U34)-methyltransferase
MLPFEKLSRDLQHFDVGISSDSLEAISRQNLADRVHGKLPEWRDILSQMPEFNIGRVDLRDGVSVSTGDAEPDRIEALRVLLLRLAPWRKGPFNIFEIEIDAEWRSDLKWKRLQDAATSLDGRRILDVGCGNGYYALRAAGQGADFVLGIDPTLNYLVQFLAVQRYINQKSVHLLPLRLHELPIVSAEFDTTFSMGVLYHQRAPLEHLAQLRDTLRPGGELVLETLILPGTQPRHETPPDRYARMRNVWMLPTISELLGWLERAGFPDCRIADISITTTDEQRSTEWMPFESLDKALDPHNEDLTIEGLPRPRRALITGSRL